MDSNIGSCCILILTHKGFATITCTHKFSFNCGITDFSENYVEKEVLLFIDEHKKSLLPAFSLKKLKRSRDSIFYF